MDAQSVGVKTDRGQILIGERIQYELLINLPAPGFRINFNLPDSVPHFEIIENKNFDTIASNGAFLIHKKLILTSFDSGSWYIPSFEVLVNRNNLERKFKTDSIYIEVGYSPADSTNELRDIKPVMEVSVIDYFWLYVAAVVLGLLIIAFLVYKQFKNRKKKPVPVFHSSLTAYEEAMQALGRLDQYDLQKPVDVKAYHTALTGIFKRYYSRKESRNLLNKTTGDVLVNIREHYDNPELLSALAEAMRCADAVKFAKYVPGATESRQSWNQVKESIGIMEKIQSPQNP